MIAKLSLITFLIVQQAAAFYAPVPSGHIGIYYWMGQIQNQSQTGFNFYNPFTSDIKYVKYIQDADQTSAACVSKEGVPINFPHIEIANEIKPDFVIPTVRRYGLEYDTVLVLRPVQQAIREMCATRTVDEIEIHDFRTFDNLLKQEIQEQVDAVNSGITINWVRIHNVVVPDIIKSKRIAIADEKAQKALAEEMAKKITVQKQTEAAVQAADLARSVAAQRAQAEKDEIIAFTEANRVRMAATAEADKIRTLSVAETEAMARKVAELKKFFDINGYANVEMVKALGPNMKIYFGPDLPNHMFLGNTPGQFINPGGEQTQSV